MTDDQREASFRVGVVGFGKLGVHLFEYLGRSEHNLETAFVFARDPSRLAGVPPELRLTDLSRFADTGTDLVVEVAHPIITREWGDQFLTYADFMPLSVTAFADEDAEQRIRGAAVANRRRLIIPHGGAVALKQLYDERDRWDSVEITMDKDLASIDFSESGLAPPSPTDQPVVVFDGPTREIARRFPRNVNTHAAIAMAGVGFDRTRSVLRASRDSRQSRLSVVAKSEEVELRIERTASISGISGASTFGSMVASVIGAAPNAGGVTFG